MKISVANYFVESYGVFSAQPSRWAKVTRDATTSRGPLKLGNRIWLPITKTGRSLTVCGYEKLILHPSDERWADTSADRDCDSFYWVSEDGSHLMRLSNHWSEASQMSTKVVGNVARCWWILKKVTKHFVAYADGYALGIVAFAEMR